MEVKTPKNAIVKFNNGSGALLCNKCRIVIAYGFNHEDIIHHCDFCRTAFPTLNRKIQENIEQ